MVAAAAALPPSPRTAWQRRRIRGGRPVSRWGRVFQSGAPGGGVACGGLRAAALVGQAPVDGGGGAEGGEEPQRWRWLRRPWRAPAAAKEGEMDGDGGAGGLANGTGGFADGTGGFADGACGLDDVAATAAAVVSAAQPLALSLSPNVAATGLRVSWCARRQRPVEPRHHLVGPHR